MRSLDEDPPDEELLELLDFLDELLPDDELLLLLVEDCSAAAAAAVARRGGGSGFACDVLPTATEKTEVSQKMKALRHELAK